jgi:dihydropteroate synthase
MAFALDPNPNVRLFPAAQPASVQASFRWIDHSSRGEGLGAWNVLFEVPETARLSAIGVLQEAGGEWLSHRHRFWLGGSNLMLSACADEFMRVEPRLGAELNAALEGFGRALCQPRPTLVMGILNVTPDSFSDGGQWLDTDAAVARALEMVEEGAHVIDIGGESTRPGAEEVPDDEELRRVLPVLERLRPLTSATLSIDTRKSAIARAALEAGADWINDVSGLTHDPHVAEAVAAHSEASLVLMHSRSKPSDERYSTEWDEAGKPVYDDVVADTMRWLRRQVLQAVARGVRPEQIWIDPGFGFGKTHEQNVELLRRLREYTSIGCPLLVGTSRKSSVGKLLGDLPPDQRLEGTAATVAWAISQGAACVRVHDVREMARVARVTDVLRGAV